MRSLISTKGRSVSPPQIGPETDWWQWLTQQTADEVENRRAHAVYRHNLYACASRTLGLVYPAAAVALGQKNFQHLAADYVSTYLPQHPDLNQYGEGFPRWVSAHSQWPGIKADLPFLDNLLAFEWAWHKAYYAELQPGLDVDAFAYLAGQRPAEILFLLDPALSLVASRFDIDTVRRQLLEHGECEYSSAVSGANDWVIWPGQWQVCLVSPSEEERLLLRMLQARKPWSAWLDRIPESVLERAIADGWIIGCALATADLNR